MICQGHYIATTDGGHDGLKPGRWIAETPMLGRYVYGATEAEAVANLKAKLAEVAPNAPWLQKLPVIRAENYQQEIENEARRTDPHE